MTSTMPTVPAPFRRVQCPNFAGTLVLFATVLWAVPACAEPLAFALPGPLPPIRLMTLLVGVHLMGLCFGLGGATMLYFWTLRWMRWGYLPPEIHRTFLFVSKVVSVGLALLWLSGLGFLAVYAHESPEKFANPKLWAKITIVTALTVNGLFVHALVLPGVLRDVSRPMLAGLSSSRVAILLVSGAVSGVSWYMAFALGLMRELNDRVACSLLLGLWLAGVVAAAFGAYLVGSRTGDDAMQAVPTSIADGSPQKRTLRVGRAIPLSHIQSVGPSPRLRRG